ncbi:cysteine desulfurase [Denitrobacterium detoxificans]|uniref:Cysteine desulfurase n=1 Tax=Denitrobacterium detoxificans TaxID=79604 RepID=A0A172RZY1_9ACTN|nr:SufS family cysteine desulfurase [Denitrobacterium detoxificans]ANE23232.1 cysteine desulfurase [Denitrobacterium detoxificans]SEO37004.1 cysteine desulfurase / selenocysteine lyase [Denitrobacterium detoxificans]
MEKLQVKESCSIQESPYKADFPLLAKNPDLVFLDSAATAQRPASVLDAQRDFYETMNANPLRGLYGLSVRATQSIEDARMHIARFIGALDEAGEPLANSVVFTRNASESLNLLAHTLPQVVNLQQGDEVVISIMEHHSNLIPWQQVCAATGAKLVYLRLDAEGCVTQQEIEEKIGPRAKIVSVTHVSNVLGVENDIPAIARRAHEMGALCAVDGAQSVPHLRVDVRALGCDFLAFSAHKLGGPMGIGVLWGKPELLDAMPPFLTGGEMIDSVTEEGAVWAPVPQKFEAGTQDAAGAYATDAAITYLEQVGMEQVEERERALAEYLCRRLQELEYVTVIGPVDGAKHVGSVAFDVRGIHPHDVASILDAQGVCIRAGHHCAQPLLSYLGWSSTCRASVGFYNDAADIDRLIEGLQKVWVVFNGRN